MKKIFLLLISILLINLLSNSPTLIVAKTVGEIQEEIKKYEDEVNRLSLEGKTLSNQIKQFDAQIYLTQLKIKETEAKIELLGGRIDGLETSIESLTKAFSLRAKEIYKMGRFVDSIYVAITSTDLNEAISKYFYLQKILASDRVLLIKLQDAQNRYKNQKADQEKLALELEKQNKSLEQQKKDKTNLLLLTKNNEKKYQDLLSSARAELAVTLGKGEETFLRNVNAGEKIGVIISGASGCSSGSHLHFEVHEGDSVADPNNYLKQISYSYSPGYDTSYYGTISPRGSWDWPLTEPIQINQGFGSHGFAKVFYPGGVHNGIDMVSTDNSVKAVKKGKLFGGSYQCGGTYRGSLLYAKIESEAGITTWYLHISPQ